MANGFLLFSVRRMRHTECYFSSIPELLELVDERHKKKEIKIKIKIIENPIQPLTTEINPLEETPMIYLMTVI